MAGCFRLGQGSYGPFVWYPRTVPIWNTRGPRNGLLGEEEIFDFLIQIHAVLLRKIISCGVCLGYPSMILLRPSRHYPLSFSSMVSRVGGVVWNLALKNLGVLLPFPLFEGKYRVQGNTFFGRSKCNLSFGIPQLEGLICSSASDFIFFYSSF